jgi:glycine betaine catabolism B
MEYEAKLIGSIERNYSVKSFRFTRAPGFDFKAGQFFYITLGKNRIKHFSFSDSPTQMDYIEFTTKMTGSDDKKSIDSLKPGDTVKIRGPHGAFTYVPELKKIAFLSGGIGITAIRSICMYLTSEGIDADVTIIYGNNQERDILFRKEFQEMAAANKKLKVVHILSDPPAGWGGRTGRIDGEAIKEEIPDFGERMFYLCGPPGMVLALNMVLDEMGVEKKNIKMENFVGY